MLYSPLGGEYKMLLFESVVDSLKLRLVILGTGWGSAATGQSLLSVTSSVIREKALVDHSKMGHFACGIQLRFTFYAC
jgi:hypothetical protein